ncbi:MAG: MarC family protein, partial [Thermoplasmata archaeon]
MRKVISGVIKCEMELDIGFLAGTKGSVDREEGWGMWESLIALIVLFFVIFDPFMSLAVFFSATKHLSRHHRTQVAIMSVGVALVISLAVL